MMSLNIDMKMIRPWNSSGGPLTFDRELLDFLTELQRIESWENIPLEFHWLTINCIQSAVLWWTLEPTQLFFPNSIWFWVLVHLSKTLCRIRAYVDFCALKTADLVHHLSKTNTSMKSLPSNLESLHRSHLIVRIPISQICRTSVPLWDLLYFFWWNATCLSNSSPVNTDASNVEDINIPHITECSSLSSIASFEHWFCLFRTWSFTLCKDDLS